MYIFEKKMKQVTDIRKEVFLKMIATIALSRLYTLQPVKAFIAFNHQNLYVRLQTIPRTNPIPVATQACPSYVESQFSIPASVSRAFIAPSSGGNTNTEFPLSYLPFDIKLVE